MQVRVGTHVVLVAFPAVFALLSCAGTNLVAKGNICGQPFEVTMNDRKDRSGFTAEAKCPNGGGLTITSSDSMTSSVIAAQSEMLGKLADLIARLAPPP